MSSSLAAAQHLKKVELHWIDVPFLEACLPSLSHSPSLQELRVHSSYASGECYVSEVTVLVSVCRVCVPSVFGLVIPLMTTILCPRCCECCSSYCK